MPDNEPNNDPINGWDTWAKHVLKEQKRLSTEVEGCREAITDFRVEVSRELGTLQTKSGVWGAVGALVILLVAWLMTQFGG